MRSVSSVGCVCLLFGRMKGSVEEEGSLDGWISLKSFVAKRQSFGLLWIEVDYMWDM